MQADTLTHIQVMEYARPIRGRAISYRIFGVWNWNYNIRDYVAGDHEEATTIAHKRKHFRRAGTARRVQDCTDHVLAEMSEADREQVKELLAGDRVGELVKVDGAWHIEQ